MTELGVQTENLAAGDLAAALDSQAIDAAEFIGPEDDKNLGLQERARYYYYYYYYYPGFWEPSATLEIQINLDRWNELPATYQEVIRSASAESMLWTMALYDIAASDEDFARILEHWRSFRRQVTPWFNLAEASLLQ